MAEFNEDKLSQADLAWNSEKLLERFAAANFRLT